MKESFSPPPIVQNEFREIHELFQKNVVPSYGRFELVLDHGSGSYLWDVNGDVTWTSAVALRSAPWATPIPTLLRL